MTGFDFLHDTNGGEPIHLPEIGLNLRVRLSSRESNGQLTVIETTHAAGYGPPLHRHLETEVYRIVTGSYLFEVAGTRFNALAGDVVCIPGGAAHRFINVTDGPAGQIVMILPGLDAAGFFTEFAGVMRGGRADPAVLSTFEEYWGFELLGPSLRLD
ncbi:cupin domain-containing protein [Roseomonas sp. KE2513]|uniref:cupin domain-containing protein n=1 Tax=Roseomonas sp. KE2513 TaxID=2479202 RepID=UPI0018DF4195|nr:cupin domain-containing protein [Roseomonas sp. KE2513]MBI0539430.1 cupin domain-containing protein [Roseomonas sp. KE2513]